MCANVHADRPRALFDAEKPEEALKVLRLWDGPENT